MHVPRRHRCIRCWRVSLKSNGIASDQWLCECTGACSQDTSVSGEVEKFLTRVTCSLVNDFVNRPVLVIGSPVYPVILRFSSPGPCCFVRMHRSHCTGVTGCHRMDRCLGTIISGATDSSCFQLSWFWVVSFFDLLFFHVFSWVILSCLGLNWASVRCF